MPPVLNGDAEGIPLVFQNFFESSLFFFFHVTDGKRRYMNQVK